MRRLLRVLPVALISALLAVGGGGPAHAIETTSYGLDVAERTNDGRLHLRLRAGETTTGRIRVWNKEQKQVVLRLSVVPAELDRNGVVSLGGDGTDADWVELDADRVELAAAAERIIEVRVAAPRMLDGVTTVVAIQVEPAHGQGVSQPAVVQRLALTTYLERDEGSLAAGLGPFPWIALVVLSMASGLVVRAGRRRHAPPAA